MIGGLGVTELVIVLVILVLLFGAKKIPELAKGLGTGMREFRKSSSGQYEVEDEKKNEEELSSGEAEDGKDIKTEDESLKDESSKDDSTIKADREEQRQS